MKEINIRKGTMQDIDAVSAIYEKIHTAEEKGELTVGWQRGIYPERETAIAALKRDDLFVIEEGDKRGSIVGAGILNQLQVDVYAEGNWKYEAKDDEVMVMHTLVIDPDQKGKGLGKQFIRFYEDYALAQNCPYLRMDTNERNTAARSLYKSMGYEEIGIAPCVFNGLEGVNLVLIEKSLKQS